MIFRQIDIIDIVIKVTNDLPNFEANNIDSKKLNFIKDVPIF